MVSSQTLPQEIKATINNNYVNHEFLDYCKNDREALNERLLSDRSFVAAFHTDDKILFVAVFDLEPLCLHVREVGGNFGRYHDALKFFAEAFAKGLKRESVSFNTEKPAVEKWAKKCGFERIPETNEFSMKVH